MPFPAPGPPRTKRMVTFSGEKVGMGFLGEGSSGIGGVMSVPALLLTIKA